MPIYEYQCNKCKRIIEVIQNINDDELIITCPNCDNILQKIISLGTFHLKGTGWYITDYASSKQPQNNISTDKKTDNTTKDIKNINNTKVNKDIKDTKKSNDTKVKKDNHTTTSL